MIIPSAFWFSLPGIITALGATVSAIYGMLNHTAIKEVKENTNGINSKLTAKVAEQNVSAIHTAELVEKDKIIAELTPKPPMG